jgi:hypothetical protein
MRCKLLPLVYVAVQILPSVMHVKCQWLAAYEADQLMDSRESSHQRSQVAHSYSGLNDSLLFSSANRISLPHQRLQFIQLLHVVHWTLIPAAHRTEPSAPCWKRLLGARLQAQVLSHKDGRTGVVLCEVAFTMVRWL